jgi:purine-nucleoside phosphorylase
MNKNFQAGINFLKDKFGKAPRTAVILGSGFSSFCKQLKNSQHLKTNEIPGALSASVPGHKAELWLGDYEGQKIAVLAGRLHGYEGHSPEQVAYLPRLLRSWGVEFFILTNASGATHKKFKAGDLVLISDHINFTGQNSLTGKELFGGERFCDMSDPYSKAWREKIRKKIPKIKEGVYVGVSGPNYETAAEIKMFRSWGADLVGMSTVWETLALHQMGAKVLGLSCVANLCTGVQKTPLSHEEVLESIQKAVEDFGQRMKIILQSQAK